MKNIHVLPTDKPSRIWVNNLKRRYELETEPLIGSNTAMHIYITSDEEIKKGDWVYHYASHKMFKYDGHGLCVEVEKIILTTDQELIKDGVQAIDDEFLEWFIKNPSCEEVETIYGLFNPMGRQVDPMNLGQNHSQCVWKYKIIIPQEESKQEWTPTQGEEVWIKVFSNWSKGTYIGYDVVKQTHLVREDEEGGGYLMSSSEVLPYYAMPNEPKQETLEEAAKEYMKGWGGITNSENSFIEGAKWQAERMYSEEEVLDIIANCDGSVTQAKKWFEQFKNI